MLVHVREKKYEETNIEITEIHEEDGKDKK